MALDLDPAQSHGDAPWRNLIIEGDNYDALRARRMSHAGRIRCIYIDPPYNTGNRDFVYNDRFVDKSHRFRHSLWLEFMYKRLRLAKDRPDAPAVLRSERLPPAPSDFEARLVDFVDFTGEVLNSRTRTRERVSRDERDLFQGNHVGDDGKDVFADLAPEAVAERAEQIRLRLKESNDRELHLRLLERFRRAIEQAGAEAPADEEILMQQLDFVLVRHPTLLTAARKRIRYDQVVDVDAPLRAELHSDSRLLSARNALYGVMLRG